MVSSSFKLFYTYFSFCFPLPPESKGTSLVYNFFMNNAHLNHKQFSWKGKNGIIICIFWTEEKRECVCACMCLTERESEGGREGRKHKNGRDPEQIIYIIDNNNNNNSNSNNNNM